MQNGPYAFPDDALLATMTEEQKVAEYRVAIAAGWSGAEASGTIWPEPERMTGEQFAAMQSIDPPAGRVFTPGELVAGPDDFPYTTEADMHAFHQQATP
jgi:hypothetical protein